MKLNKKYPMSQICYIYDKNLDDIYVFALDYENRCAVDMMSNCHIQFPVGTEINYYTLTDLVQEQYALDKSSCKHIHMLDMLYLLERNGFAPRGFIFIPLNHQISVQCKDESYLSLQKKDFLIREFVDNTEVSISNIKQLNKDIRNKILTKTELEDEFC